jgi:uncharacterized protein YecT (DUF1311 family)
MKKNLMLICFLCSLTYSFGQTQLEMNDAENKKYLQADSELNMTYQKIIKEYKDDTTFIKNLVAAEKIWIQFRDAEMKMKYPDRGADYYGSVQPMCWSIYLTELTQSRISTLKVWLDGIEEGDACVGSVKTKE